MAEYCNQYYFSEDNQDNFEMIPDPGDSFQSWQGLRGPYYTPSVGDDGYLYWTNNGQLPNPEPVRIVGRDGRGITLTGQCETVAELPEDPDQGEAWAVGEEEPFECYAWFGEWVDLGLLFPAGQDGVSPAVTITQTSTGHKVKITDKTHPAGQEFDVDNGTPGDPGQDGVSPAVTITQTSTGHKVKITDKTHPAGQEFDVDNGTPGAPGQGVPAGGSAGQFYRKASALDYDGEWHTLSAGDSSYDSSLTYSSGTVGQELSSQRNTLNHLEDGLAIIVNGDTCTTAVPVGGYAYIKNNTHGLAEGLYTNTSASAFPTSGGTANSSVFTAVSGGGLNSLKDSIPAALSNAVFATGPTLYQLQNTAAGTSYPIATASNLIPSGKTAIIAVVYSSAGTSDSDNGNMYITANGVIYYTARLSQTRIDLYFGVLYK